MLDVNRQVNKLQFVEVCWNSDIRRSCWVQKFLVLPKFFLPTTSTRGPIHTMTHSLLPPMMNSCFPPSMCGLLSWWRVSSHVLGREYPPLAKGLFPTVMDSPVSQWMTSSLNGSPPSTNGLLPEWLVSSLNNWYPIDEWSLSLTICLLPWWTLSPPSINCLLCQWTASSWSPPVC